MRFAEIDPITLEIIDVYNNYALIDKVSDTFIKIPENLLKSFRCKAELHGEKYQSQIKKLMMEWVGKPS